MLPLMRGFIFVPFLFFFTNGQVRQVHVLTRHGARDHLRKSAVTLDETGGILTTEGEVQMEQLGSWLKIRYHDDDLPIQRIVSSPTQRTIVSAMGLARGYTNATNVPVYSTKEINDVDIRGYNKCPTFQNHLESLYETDEWNSLERSESPLLKRLAQTDRYARYSDADGIIPLEDAWNVFDTIAVCQSSGQSQAHCTSENGAPILTGDEWTELQRVVHKAELLKFHSDTAGDLLGTNVLRRIAQEPQQGLFVYSGHYPTLLPVLAKLNVDDYFPYDIPPFASALLFEDYIGGPFRVLIKSGLDDGAVVIREWNSRDDFVRDISQDSYDWCASCDNHSADVCLALSDAPSLNSTVAGFVLGSGVGALLVVAWWTFRHKCSHLAKETPRRAVMHTNGDFS